MSAKIIDGKKLAQKLLDQAKKDVEKMDPKPKLVVIQVGDDPASTVYVNNKKKACEKIGLLSEVIKLPETITQDELLNEIDKLNVDKYVHGMIVQLPIPEHISVPLIMKEIDPKKDADGFCAYNLGKMFISEEFEHLAPATPVGIIKMLEEYDIKIRGKHAVMIGASNIVGKPIAIMLKNRGATVSICDIDTADISIFTKMADILIVAVGKENLITADMVKDGVAVIDVGMNRSEKDGKLCGDVDFDNVKEKASFISPVPKGVGPMTIASLVLNTIKARERILEE
ncbi:MAG: bifunctional 5,10-methylenetetrahydrofolate dehydrogenase/5,10-methenyltetrahydrofolate cyclohydrolase [Minisyncoccales bacterium]